MIEGGYGALSHLYDALTGDVEYERWAAYLERLLAAAPRPCKKVFEVACGTGRMAILLKKRGYEAAASDLSDAMLAAAAQNARKAGVKLDFVRQDMRQLSIPPQDAILCVCDGVNHLLEKRELMAFFQGAYRCLRPGGMLLFDVSSAHKLEHILGDELFYEDGEDLTYFWQNTWVESARQVRMELTFFERQGAAYLRSDETLFQAAHETEMLKQLLLECGFAHVAAYDFMTEDPPKPDSERIQFAASKAS